MHPAVDHHGRPLTDKPRAKLAGSRICGQYIAVLDGFEGDQDFMRLIFHLKRLPLSRIMHGALKRRFLSRVDLNPKPINYRGSGTAAHTQVCYYCGAAWF